MLSRSLSWSLTPPPLCRAPADAVMDPNCPCSELLAPDIVDIIACIIYWELISKLRSSEMVRALTEGLDSG